MEELQTARLCYVSLTLPGLGERVDLAPLIIDHLQFLLTKLTIRRGQLLLARTYLQLPLRQ